MDVERQRTAVKMYFANRTHFVRSNRRGDASGIGYAGFIVDRTCCTREVRVGTITSSSVSLEELRACQCSCHRRRTFVSSPLASKSVEDTSVCVDTSLLQEAKFENVTVWRRFVSTTDGGKTYLERT